MKNKEQDIQKSIIDYLRLKKYVIIKHHSTGFTVREGKSVAFRYGEKGVSDLIACAPWMQFWAIEVKRKYGKPTEDQLDFIARVNKNGGVAFVAYSIDDVIKKVEAAN